MNTIDVASAAALVGFGLNVRATPTRDQQYTELTARYLNDAAFAATVTAVATGLDLLVAHVGTGPGIVLVPTASSPFAMSVTQYAKRAKADGAAAERVLHALAHLGTAALAFPRPADLDNPSYTGRVTAAGVEAFIREAVDRLNETVDDADIDPDTPGLTGAWQVYARRTSVAIAGRKRTASTSTTAIVARTLNVLADAGMLITSRTQDTNPVYRTTARYRWQVSDAANSMFAELSALGVSTVSDGSGTVTTIEWAQPSATDTEDEE